MIPIINKEPIMPSSIVLGILSEKPRLTVKDLYEYYLNRSKKRMTLQGFYKLISQLIKQQVLIKEGKLVSINASWIYGLIKFTEKVSKLYFGKEAYAFNILLREGEKKSFTFETVKEMDNFWHHALFLVVQYYENEKNKDKDGYVYTEHGWFQIVRSEMEVSLAKLYSEHGMKLYQVVGSDSFLDSLVEKTIKEENYFVAQKEIKSFGKNYYGMVIGDFLFETKLPIYIYELMEDIYGKTTSLAQFKAEDILQIIEEPARTNIKISRDKKGAMEFRKKIKAAF